jgi:hypothetical protein
MLHVDWLLSVADHQATRINTVLLIFCALTGIVALVRAQLRMARTRNEEAEARHRAEIYRRFMEQARGRQLS